ncbi:hypothetical protein [Novosphingobium sp. SG720]|uniref:hypothetical protein n=1 Tax=Novosphingobium sp. SG720 TaxID=2586998 RepID=UPI0014460EC2|nr:hypothetical protein [Novosphingobium sp. SG720]NKJ40806.1 hypothetical protein [Novosphingobium sp. SG720]
MQATVREIMESQGFPDPADTLAQIYGQDLQAAHEAELSGAHADALKLRKAAAKIKKTLAAYGRRV